MNYKPVSPHSAGSLSASSPFFSKSVSEIVTVAQISRTKGHHSDIVSQNCLPPTGSACPNIDCFYNINKIPVRAGDFVPCMLSVYLFKK